VYVRDVAIERREVRVHTFAERRPPTQQTAPARNSIVHVRHAIGNRTARLSEPDTWEPEKGSTTAGASRLGHDFGLISVRGPTLQAHGSPSGKQVEGGEESPVEEDAPAAKDDGGAAPAPPAPAAPPAAAKIAGVDSFKVKWSKPSGAGATNAKLRLDYTAKFTKDATHDPARAEFRQSVIDSWDITAGPNKGRKGSRAKRDDNYSRADDMAGNAITDVDFSSNDNPGYADLDKDDVLDYSFTAEQTIIDTSQANKVIATRGPHTGTVKGKHPRTYTGLPANLS
jgi:hypothetical protein